MNEHQLSHPQNAELSEATFGITNSENLSLELEPTEIRISNFDTNRADILRRYFLAVKALKKQWAAISASGGSYYINQIIARGVTNSVLS